MLLMAVFALGVALTVLLPMTASDTTAAPASPLQAGVIIPD